jgi:hypothetical protein
MLVASLAAFMMLGHVGLADYREQFPMPDLTVPTGWGVNVNLKDMDDQDIEAIADTGAKWIRLDLLWSRAEQKSGKYDFSKYDPVIDGFSRKGIRPILILDYGNKVHDVEAPSTREGRTAYADFAVAAVNHYRHRGVIWEIWNEPNLAHFWRGAPSADEYAALVRVAVPAMRAASPDEWIIGGATSRFDWTYLEDCFSKGMLTELDGVSIHPYRDQNSPESVVADWTQLRSLLAKYAPGKPITLICSEWGYSTYSKGVSERAQGEFAAREYLANLSAGVPLTIWYAWRDRPDASSEKEQHFGLVDGDLHPKQAHDMVASTLGALNGYTFDSNVDLGDGNFGLIFKKGMDRKFAAWTTANTSTSVHLPATAAWFARGNNRQITLSRDVQILSQK